MLVAILQHISDQDDPFGIVARLAASVPSGRRAITSVKVPPRSTQKSHCDEFAINASELRSVKFRAGGIKQPLDP